MSATQTANAASLDAHQYAEALRQSLMEDLFEGEELEPEEIADADSYSVGDFTSSAAIVSLVDLDKELEEFQDHEVIKSILDQGRVLKEYARDIDDRLRQVELESIQDYIQESDNLVALHEQIKNCDAILGHMEGMLGKFQQDLGKVSEEIRQLQVQSQTMSLKLKNRRLAENKLGSFVEQLAVSDDLVTNIIDNEVNEDYLEYLLGLDRKLRFVAEDDIARNSQAKRDVEPAIERLRIKAITKVRDFILNKIYTLKRPKTNIQIIQQSVLLKYKYFARFLRQHGADVYDEVCSEYVGVLSRILSQRLRNYLTAIEKMHMVVAGPNDLLGAPEASQGVNVLSIFGKGQARNTTEAIFELGERAKLLTSAEPIIPHMAEFEGKRFPYEAIFKNVHKYLMDTATSEYLFAADFFDDEAVFRELLLPIVSVVEADVTSAMQEQHDLVGVMLMIRVNQEHRRIMMKRRVPCLDDYLDRVHLLLWPRFKVLFDAQLNSVKAYSDRHSGVSGTELAAHFVVRRYAALSASLLSLMAEQDGEDQGVFKASSFTDIMDRLWATVFDLMLRISNSFKDKRQGIIFLIVNNHHIVNVLKGADVRLGGGAGQAGAGGGSPLSQPRSPSAAGGVLGKSGATAIKDCEDQLASCTSLYVEEQLGSHFRDLLEFVRKAEQTQKRLAVPDGAPVPGYTPAQAAPLLAAFAAKWTGAIDAMHREVTANFAATGCGRDVLQASMTQLLLYYTRMLELLKRQGPEGLQMAKEAVNIPSIMYEIKRITKS